MGAYEIDLPSDGVITREIFEALPHVPRLWEWELRAGHLELTHMPMTMWIFNAVTASLGHWRRQGHEICGRQYVADGVFLRGGAVENHLVVDAVVFRLGHEPDGRVNTHDAADIHAIIEVESGRGSERDVVAKQSVYAQLGVPNYWIIRDTIPESDYDGTISMYELVDGSYKLTGTRLVSQLAEPASDER